MRFRKLCNTGPRSKRSYDAALSEFPDGHFRPISNPSPNGGRVVIDAAALGIREAQALFTSGELTVTAYAGALLDQIERFDPTVRAWESIDAETVLRDASIADRALQEGRSIGPLHGIPVGVKDLLDIAGSETKAGSVSLPGKIADRDAAVVARLRDAGSLILGKTAMTVYAAMDPADTTNPWNPQHTPGGSSSGSAAAVASCMCPAALGSQTAGSVVRPAAYCGVTGLKPTYEAISRDGLFACAWSMDHVGILARSVDDVFQLFAVAADVATPTLAHNRPEISIGIPDRYFNDDVSPDVAAAFESALDSLRQTGAKLQTVTLPACFEAGVDAGIVIMYAEMAAVHRERFASQKLAYPFRIKTLIEIGLKISAADYLRAQQVRREFCVEMSNLLKTVECLVTPTTPAPAPKGLDATGDWRFNLPFSASGHPALSVPCGMSRDKLPIGLQLVAGYWCEQTLFSVGERFQATTNWHRRRPPMMQMQEQSA